MNRLVLAGIASIVVLAIVALAIAAASDDGDDETAIAPTATAPAVSPTALATAVPATTAPAPQPTLRPDTPVSNTPGANQPGPSPTWTAIPLPRHPEPAPIDGVEVLTLESFPPQYMLKVKAGLPSGCAEPLSHEVLPKLGNVVQVVVLNSLPDNAICTAIYGMYDLNINLGSDFTSGQTYTVRVNEREITFKAQ
jgi:hypothetical protein